MRSVPGGCSTSGAGDGWFSESLLAELPAVEQIVCWDINYNELELATDDPRLVRTTTAPGPGFDLVLVLDVLEHIDDPVAFIDTQLRPLTAPGTAVLVGVPAHPRLFSDHDRALGHFRRYRPNELLAPGGRLDRRRGARADVLLAGRTSGRVGDDRAAASRPSATRPTAPGSGRAARPSRVPSAAVLGADAALTRRLGRVGSRLPGLSHWVFGRVR